MGLWPIPSLTYIFLHFYLCFIKLRQYTFTFQTTASKVHVDHQAQAYVAPRKVMAEANGNAPKPVTNANGKPKWGGAEICPRCNRSVSMASLHQQTDIYEIFLKGANGKIWGNFDKCINQNILNYSNPPL